MNFIKLFQNISMQDIALVGGKNASLGAMIQALSDKGIEIPQGFAITSQAYWHHLQSHNLMPRFEQLVAQLHNASADQIEAISSQIRALITDHALPEDLQAEIAQGYLDLCRMYKKRTLDVAIRSSATAEDLPNASFAGQQESYLNVHGIESVLKYVKKCMASLFTQRAIIYRNQKGFDHLKVGISVGVQKMVRSDKASSGVIFTLDTESGFKDVVIINAAYGLGELIVQGTINPDEFHVHKPTLAHGYRPIIKKYLGTKQSKLLYSKTQGHDVKMVGVSKKLQHQFSLTDDEILSLARQAVIIENYYSSLSGSWSPMDIEWAKDGLDHKLYIVQARPETVQSTKNHDTLIQYHLDNKEKHKVLVTGLSIGCKIASGKVHVLKNVHEAKDFKSGDVLVTGMTDPDWVPLMKKASAIVTDQGGRTCHAAIVSRELGIPALVGTIAATQLLKSGAPITVDCSQGSTGYVYDQIVPFSEKTVILKEIPKSPVPILLNIAEPDRAFELSFLPVSGVGLARIEFIISNTIKIHPMALARPELITSPKLVKQIEQITQAYGSWADFFVQTLAQGIATIAAGFYPRPVIVRMSDFKTNEYRNLIAGNLFESIEENPMLGFRGASRYCSPQWAPAFALECRAIKKARKEMGLTNIKLMIPFVRTIQEAECSLKALKEQGIERGQDKLEILMMCEIPSNVLLLQEFSNHFDGFSIGSNDLTQLTLGVDRDSGTLTSFDERDPAVKKMLAMALESSKKAESRIGICGQAPSDFPEIADFLIEHGIDSMSLNADSILPFLLRYKK